MENTPTSTIPAKSKYDNLITSSFGLIASLILISWNYLQPSNSTLSISGTDTGIQIGQAALVMLILCLIYFVFSLVTTFKK